MATRKERRAKTEAYIIKMVGELLPGDPHNPEKYRVLFAQMDDDAFENYVKALGSGEQILAIEAPNLSKHKLTIDNNFRVAEMIGHKFFERLWLIDPATGTRYLSPVEYLIVDLSLRRQQQMLVEKRSIPDNNRHVDDTTGQVTGDSHSSSLTFPELQNLRAQGLEYTAVELTKFRGGDIVGLQRMNRSLLETGGVDLDAIEALGPTRPKSVQTLSSMLFGMHIDNNL